MSGIKHRHLHVVGGTVRYTHEAVKAKERVTHIFLVPLLREQSADQNDDDQFSQDEMRALPASSGGD
jgi:hypothetical protein